MKRSPALRLGGKGPRKCFASNVVSHSHRALARWSTLAEVLRNRFNGFHERVPLTGSSSTAFKRSEEEETVKTVLRFLMRGV